MLIGWQDGELTLLFCLYKIISRNTLPKNTGVKNLMII